MLGLVGSIKVFFPTVDPDSTKLQMIGLVIFMVVSRFGYTAKLMRLLRTRYFLNIDLLLGNHLLPKRPSLFLTDTSRQIVFLSRGSGSVGPKPTSPFLMMPPFLFSLLCCSVV